MSQLVPNNLILYSTSFCHLCEAAELLLNQANQNWLSIEITEDVELFNRYGLKIPVLHNIATQQEICWPFTLPDIQMFSR